ncbi:hypothetical protein CONCODRAFT_70274 [Conidiobolus coronatus NRRL 28638]|uniref:C2 domain-containing protein n=1 Tax=Conidiobolus coronatus (strain ATCC 28846 / CBS 209.66 / NRRL 28638) TaxID=796925 RepID=A0A137P7G7_CONC2|nr:hypothetical protein CONCODRAFT_70274 [Conidiobolus coronatus NRRL 28638]|eukprot:KXN70871.1 hypothetical protein CONCODRAFT_70274 [Conidiobolus coronatus NRRL 28638]
MTKVKVDVIEARDLSGDSEVKGINNAYLQLYILNPLICQRQTTKPQSGLGASISFTESFEFDASEADNLEVKLCKDEPHWDEKLYGARIPIREIFEMGGSMSGWFPLGEVMGEKRSGEILLNIHTY